LDRRRKRGKTLLSYIFQEILQKKKDFFAGLKVDEMRPEEDRLHDCG